MKRKHILSALLVVLVVFAAINIRSEMRHASPSDYGKLSGEAMPAEAQPVEVVQEAPAPVSDETAADPMLVAPAAREQYLHANTSAAPVIEPVLEPVVAPTAATAAPLIDQRGKSRFTIVGGPEGVTLIERPQR